MKIAGFNIKKKQLIIFGTIALVFVISSAYSKSKKQKELEQRLADEQARIEAAQAALGDKEVLTLEEKQQRKLVEKYGNPPEGFKWDLTGEAVPIADESSCEEVVFTFLRALSMLDFSTAQRYSSESSVISDYSDYYAEYTSGYTDYYDNFIRKQFKTSIESLETVGVGSNVVFADGTQYLTINVRALDLQNKDFWQEDREALFNELRTYKEVENDESKVEQRIYEYMLSKYDDGSVGKRDYTIELVLTKANGGGWLVSNDRELEAVLKYEHGVDVANFIKSEFLTWNTNKTIEDQRNRIEGMEE